ncbi:pantetheine-phosphate adenylyltransferase [Clostridium saccharobutylicum]|uniref:Phosphopantetheine adenylyltransferase n=1 Tax=Clostridium saccharobutylicum DSM 13864 TaxID=1345695 RepID=U5MNP6_CLOSA|nr:pantetheine-phosphate adenylyltransferase [Clostridium saccharobutylicum]AGX42384.1 phosphopantetheine adenylyltransferase CoaD [Clostridium saccharobutylicum DSM 13864]AQR89665.1 phosphopantetheine adenylyltransferase [Clostridium saccharobutylicum]AQR99567.1 phosphopantetheine adenylyltransferase [Clostridium saccharobutylicum]AQS13553.1 phosphopantetheine adenylyltransferase [Clostridium saccharobutylicum]MBA2904257.1 pantetheine-phosphate adenylyltransferase [Clostridium saccharobutylic
MKVAVYPGSFDPITNGHLDIIKRGAKVFDKIIVAVLVNIDKKCLFEINERVELIKKVTSNIDNIEVVSFSGLLMNFLKENNANVILKGLRTTYDFEYELQMAFMNNELDSSIETICMMTSQKNLHISSSAVKQVARFGGNIEGLVPKEIVSDIMTRINI